MMKELKTATDLEAALTLSEEQPVLLFKHSTACPVSGSAYQRVQSYLQSAGDAAPQVYMVKVIEARPVSNEIAQRLQVTHQSPQMLLVQNRQAVWNASHGGIDGRAIDQALERVA
jgi:bacillithiol system protein YtxJ